MPLFADQIVKTPYSLTLASVPEGLEALVLADLARKAQKTPVLHIARDDARLAVTHDALGFFAPDVEVITLPAWDCLPYDRVSPHPDISSQRMATLARLANSKQKGPRVILTTINSALQKLPPKAHAGAETLVLETGAQLDMDTLSLYLNANGYHRTTTVGEAGEYAIRGGLLDLFPAGAENPLRIDFFGDEIDSIRPFDALDQRTIRRIDQYILVPAGEMTLSKEAIRRFRQGYVAEFGTVTDEDPLYAAISEGRRVQGAEHWLPLFYGEMETLFDYLDEDTVVTLDHQVEEAAAARHGAIIDYFETRKAAREGELSLSSPYKPLDPHHLYLLEEDWAALKQDHNAHSFTPFATPESDLVFDAGGHSARDFAPERQNADINIYEAVIEHILAEQKAGRRVMMLSYSNGARDRLAHVLKDHGLTKVQNIDDWESFQDLAQTKVGLGVLSLERGFRTDEFSLITEQDVLGDRLVRKARKSKKAENFISEASSLAPGDLVVHVEHGIGRYEGLQTIDVSGAPHDCVWLTYQGGDRLYVPVENIEVLSRYGGEGSASILDKLGGSGWQARKAKMKKRVREMANELIKIAAARTLRKGEVIDPPQGLYDEFCARFPFAETEDQLRAASDVLEDLHKGQPMDRLICGDVGFGKTEVALRAAFAAVMAGHQVAVVCPTTLLARQHAKSFEERFKGLPVVVRQLSRLVPAKTATQVRAGLSEGNVDIVIGTHALLGKSVEFKRLGLVIVDEEQHFGVAHKERLKKLRSNVHMLTLTATPIPRTLQLALSGIRDLSLIATPPVDRLAVRTFISPFDEMVVREALLREHYRGGQSFFVVPRISDLKAAADFLNEHVSEIRYVTAHGQMPPSQIEDVMNAFYEGKYDVLLSTTIVESGLDIPRANTMVVHRADRFGLAQLYQLRGRVGRSKLRAYAYLTIDPKKPLSSNAQKRLEVLQSLDSLGAGFTLASHDMDIRGGGNLLGEEQSGHIKEVGVELYQQMLEEAVAAAKGGFGEEEAEDTWSPQINLGATVLIPENYIPDLNLRMSLYRRIAELETGDAVQGLAAEMIDRFGELPAEVDQLFRIIEIKQFAKQAGISRIEAGAKGMTISFRNDRFANPGGMVAFVSSLKSKAKLRPDHRLVFFLKMEDVDARLNNAYKISKKLARLADHSSAAA